MKKSWEFYVAGVAFHELDRCIDDIEDSLANEEKVELKMVLEPTNKFDRNATQLVYPSFNGELMIGYVPAKISAQVAESIKSEKFTMMCEVKKVDREESPWRKCKVIITREDV
jgi:hypothetical protein